MSVVPPFLSIEMKRPSSVRRCLFERPTAEKQEKDFATQESRLFEDAKAFREKWGLDPKTGSVVNGSEYECVQVSRESIPSFYSKGYQPRKPRPVQSLRRERSPLGLSLVPTRLNFDCPKPVKRKCPFGEEENNAGDENRGINVVNNNAGKRVPIDGEIVTGTGDCSVPISSASSQVSSSLSTTCDFNNSPTSLPTSILLHNSNKKESKSFSDVSPRCTDLCTPQQRPRNLTQKTMKDFLTCKKPRCVSKIVPRT